MEIFYIFSMGVISTLLILGIVYSVITLLKIKKELEICISEIEDLKRDLETKIDEVHGRLDNEIIQFGNAINKLNNKI